MNMDLQTFVNYINETCQDQLSVTKDSRKYLLNKDGYTAVYKSEKRLIKDLIVEIYIQGQDYLAERMKCLLKIWA